MIPLNLSSIKIPALALAAAGIVGMIVLTLWYVYNLGQDHNETKWAAKVEKGRAVVEELRQRASRVTVRTEIRYVDRVKVIKETARVIEKKIPVYIPVDTPDLPSGFRVLHDSAATSTLPGAPEVGSPVKVRDLAKTVNRNYAICYQWKAALDEQLRWAQEQRKLYLSECKRLKQSCS